MEAVEPTKESNGSLPHSPEHLLKPDHVVIDGNSLQKKSMDSSSDVLSNPSVGGLIVEDKVSLTWDNLNVEAELPAPSCFTRIKAACCGKGNAPMVGRPTKQILFNVSGNAEPGSLLAIMGASGAGKTSLLNVLARQNLRRLQISGSIEVNKRDIGSAVKSISAYVQQDNLFIGTLTVKEHLTFQAILRMDKSFSIEAKKKRVKEVIAQLGLTKCQDTIIGVPGRIRGISGGEQKRLSFAAEIITNPKLLFVDEPTSGLDSFMAENVISALQAIAEEGRTILTTIHQPSSELYQMFDRLLLMSEGRTAFLGATNDAISFFQSAGHACPPNYNPADHYVHTLAIIPGDEEKCRKKAAAICDAFEATREVKSSTERRNTIIAEDDYDYSKARFQYQAGFWMQMRAVLWRAFMSDKREPYVSSMRIGQAAVIALICGLVYFGQEENQDGIENLNGAMFFSITTLTFNSITGSLFIFPAEFPVFIKEHKLGMYRTDVYFLSKTLAELPWYVLSPTIYVLIMYWMVGLHNNAATFFTFYALVLLTANCALSFGYFISCMSPSVQVATGIGPPLIMPFMLFGGFFIKDRSIPDYFIPLKWISWFKYAFECVIINQWQDVTSIDCGSIPMPGNNTMTGSSDTPVCLSTGLAVIQQKGYDIANMERNIGCLLAVLIGFRFLGFLILLLRVSRR